MKEKVKKHFIAGAICPQCKKFDTIQWIYQAEEHIECVACGYSEKKPELNQNQQK
ncbi:MAG TPA: YheV family putative zinc ribbon protein [Gammaproteobacteria bacterium]|nr:YheV family putative zinc ribbon protein [Gammaproteobacteria bacterium]